MYLLHRAIGRYVKWFLPGQLHRCRRRVHACFNQFTCRHRPPNTDLPQQLAHDTSSNVQHYSSGSGLHLSRFGDDVVDHADDCRVVIDTALLRKRWGLFSPESRRLIAIRV
jgi:hypothetical protein